MTQGLFIVALWMVSVYIIEPLMSSLHESCGVNRGKVGLLALTTIAAYSFMSIRASILIEIIFLKPVRVASYALPYHGYLVCGKTFNITRGTHGLLFAGR